MSPDVYTNCREVSVDRAAASTRLARIENIGPTLRRSEGRTHDSEEFHLDSEAGMARAEGPGTGQPEHVRADGRRKWQVGDHHRRQLDGRQRVDALTARSRVRRPEWCRPFGN